MDDLNLCCFLFDIRFCKIITWPSPLIKALEPHLKRKCSPAVRFGPEKLPRHKNNEKSDVSFKSKKEPRYERRKKTFAVATRIIDKTFGRVLAGTLRRVRSLWTVDIIRFLGFESFIPVRRIMTGQRTDRRLIFPDNTTALWFIAWNVDANVFQVNETLERCRLREIISVLLSNGRYTPR
jgi:hypothetical protein